ncbi:hypothetical protein SAMN02910265_01902 [Ruminococcus flavefaciens]|uniref:Uncharacterized protein n=1 Tax=Ruminococcus flavefaciens TaxID=1265 RepID=A0A1H6JX65_RUMFL|nr:hypothetical protein [Ruminococcus flavefaciens]SEH64605.1 hypothetical protein SAMN02910265_01902 [Ruminococcus flavefaciens]
MNAILKAKKISKDVAKKIVALPQKMSVNVSDKMILKETCWIESLYKGYNFWIKIIPNLSLQFFCYELSNRIKNIIKDSDSFKTIKNMWLEKFNSNISEDYRYFLTQFFSINGVIDDEICRRIINYGMELDNQDYRYWLTLDISNTTFSYQRGFYPEYYTDRRKLLKKIANELKINVPFKHDSNKKTLCIVTYLLSTDVRNSMQRIALMVSNNLKQYFDNITVITLDSFVVTKREKKRINTISKWRDYPAIDNKSVIDSLFGSDIRVIYSPKKDYKERYKFALEEIYKINPFVIIDISDEFSPISYYYSQDFPTVYMPLRVGASSSFFNIFQGTKWKLLELNSKYHFYSNEKLIQWSFPESVPITENNKYTRLDLEISENAFIIITIAKCYNCCNESFVDEIACLLKNNLDMIWLIVGDKAPAYMHKKYPELFIDNKVIERSFENNLMSLCSLCNVLLRTDNTGGSGATAIAALAGLPIAMTNFLCDPMRWLGRDYSNIGDYHDLMMYIQQLHDNNDLYINKKQETLDLVNKAVDSPDKWKYLAENIIFAAEEWLNESKFKEKLNSKYN